MKTLTIKEVYLTDEQIEDKCSNCVLNPYNCTPTRYWLKNSMGFKDCSLGVNYQEVEA